MNPSSHKRRTASPRTGESTAPKKTAGGSLEPLSDEQLHGLAERARKVTAGEEAEREKQQRQRDRRRRLQRRIFIWLLELFVLLAVIEYFILTPRRAERDALRRQEAAAELVHPGKGKPFEVLGDRGLVMTALTEVVPAYRADLEMLAPGSREALSRQIAYAEEHQLPIEVENSVGMRFRLVPPGSFLMGSPADEPGRWEGEKLHRVTVTEPLYVGKFEVTQQQWERVMGTTPAFFRGARRPVESITWNEAVSFTRRLAELEGLPVDTYRLPSEAEWEYAGRAGTGTAYVFGNDPAWLPHFAAFEDNSYGRTHEVGRFRPNAFGLYDMHGNVWEWCRDRFSNYPEVELPDPTGGKWYNIRGGNWREQASDCRSAVRTRLPPDSRGNILGVRVVRAIPEL